MHEAHSFQQNSDYKPNLKGCGCEGPYPINVLALHLALLSHAVP